MNKRVEWKNTAAHANCMPLTCCLIVVDVNISCIVMTDLFIITQQVTWILCNMMTSSNGNFSALLAFSEGKPLVTGGFPSQRPVNRNFDAFFDLRLNKRLSKQSRCQWFETPSHSLWRHYNKEEWSWKNERKVEFHNTDRNAVSAFELCIWFAALCQTKGINHQCHLTVEIKDK